MNSVPPAPAPGTSPAAEAKESTPTYRLSRAYLLWLFLGIFGAHRFYLRRPLSGLLYTFTLGGFFIAWGLDFVLLPFLIRGSRARASAPPPEHLPEWDGERRYPELDPLRSILPLWSTGRLLRLWFMMVILPTFYYTFMGDWVFTLVFTLLCIALTFPSLIEALHWLPLIGPMLEQFSTGFRRLLGYYAQRTPPGFLRGAFYPLLLIFSENARDELKYFKALASFGFLFALLEWGLWLQEYFLVYQPDIGLFAMLFEVKLIMALMNLLCCVLFVLPMVRTLSYVKLSRGSASARKIVLSALIGIALLASSQNTTSSMSYEDFIRLGLRFEESERFRIAEGETLERFLRLQRPIFTVSASARGRGAEHQGGEAGADKAEAQQDEKQWGSAAVLSLDALLSAQLTESLQRQLESDGPVPAQEVDAYQLFLFHEGGGRAPLLLRCLAFSSGDCARARLFALSSDGTSEERPAEQFLSRLSIVQRETFSSQVHRAQAERTDSALSP